MQGGKKSESQGFNATQGDKGYLHGAGGDRGSVAVVAMVVVVGGKRVLVVGG